ncbi:hypothetical protein EJD97_003415 [Solanum chilense]|uniref:Integrase core domain containing protein n=1 Tax=Solanum chilense TaxID=4083 RepID=A0A6N2C161_SOLCI|nr:hypothetical protein EJD97_003415 [Solanum chilense]
MQRSIIEAEERLERRMVQHTERKITEVHQFLDAFELRVLARPAPQVPDSEAPSAGLAEDTVMAALFATFEIPKPPPRENAKRRRVREEDEAIARKKECREMEAARRASIADEEACRIRAIESAAGESSSRNMAIEGGTADSVVGDEDTTEGVQITEVVSFGEPDPPAC